MWSNGHMNLMSVVSGWNRKLNLKNARAVFDRACELLGGEDKLATVFQERRAYTVSQQASVAADIASGVKPSELAANAEPGWKFADLTAMIEALGGRKAAQVITRAEHAAWASD